MENNKFEKIGNKTTVVTARGEKMSFISNSVDIGTQVNFTAMDLKGESFSIENIEGKKVISFYPLINTGVCTLQTMEISKISKEFDSFTFYSISKDALSESESWCESHGSDHNILSDIEGNFGEITGLSIKEKPILGRGVMILDENNIVQYLEVLSELSEGINFESLKDALKLL